MNHYWTADEPAAVRQAQAEDWLDDLIEFGPEIVGEACREWRHKPGGRRPTPGDIRTLCIEAQRLHRERIALASPTSAREWTYQDRRAALAELRERNRESEEANWERLRRLRDEIDGTRPIRRHAATLGVKAREYTPEELRAGRIALGLERAEAAE